MIFNRKSHYREINGKKVPVKESRVNLKNIAKTGAALGTLGLLYKGRNIPKKLGTLLDNSIDITTTLRKQLPQTLNEISQSSNNLNKSLGQIDTLVNQGSRTLVKGDNLIDNALKLDVEDLNAQTKSILSKVDKGLNTDEIMKTVELGKDVMHKVNKALVAMQQYYPKQIKNISTDLSGLNQSLQKLSQHTELLEQVELPYILSKKSPKERLTIMQQMRKNMGHTDYNLKSLLTNFARKKGSKDKLKRKMKRGNLSPQEKSQLVRMLKPIAKGQKKGVYKMKGQKAYNYV
jgi:prefoldin subunit 5